MGRLGRLPMMIKPKLVTVFIIVLGIIDGIDTAIRTGDLKPIIWAVGARISASDIKIDMGIMDIRNKNVAPCVLEAENFMCVLRVIREVYFTRAFISIIQGVFILMTIFGIAVWFGKEISPAGTSTSKWNLIPLIFLPLFSVMLSFNLIFSGGELSLALVPFSGVFNLIYHWKVLFPFILL